MLVTHAGDHVGHRLLGVRVVATDGDGTGTATYRSVPHVFLLCLFVPVFIMEANGRGLHDKAARTVVVRAR